MKKLFFLALMAIIYSCQMSNPKVNRIDATNLGQVQIDSILSKFNFTYENPITLDGGKQIVIPISTDLMGRERSYGKGSYYGDDVPKYWNVLFYNDSTKVTELLTHSKYRISRIETYQEITKSKIVGMKNKILYEIADIDFNTDTRINSLDPNFLFISETDGSELQRVSPDNEDLMYHEVLADSKQIIMKTRRDVNQDMVFNSDDRTIWYITKFENGSWSRIELVDSVNRSVIENLYFEQWLMK